MNIKLSKEAQKFLTKLSEKDKERLRLKLKALVLSIEQHGAIPFKEMDIRKLGGEWQGFMRMRVGKTRLIFRLDRDQEALFVHEIDFRGDVYKV